jgi:hypothetical protein
MQSPGFDPQHCQINKWNYQVKSSNLTLPPQLQSPLLFQGCKNHIYDGDLAPLKSSMMATVCSIGMITVGTTAIILSSTTIIQSSVSLMVRPGWLIFTIFSTILVCVGLDFFFKEEPFSPAGLALLIATYKINLQRFLHDRKHTKD